MAASGATGVSSDSLLKISYVTAEHTRADMQE
jgi:hypothetical protein